MGMKVNGTSGLTFPDTTTLASAGQASVRAWVNFNGTGTVAIRASYNVASITDNGTGDYTVNFDTALPDANYAALVTNDKASTVNQVALFSTTVSSTTSAFNFQTREGNLNNTGSGAASDQANIRVAFFR
jgi:hypothetical protein